VKGLHRAIGVLLAVSGACSVNAAQLAIRVAETGALQARVTLAEGEGWCLLWNHSVAGFPVEDCYQVRSGRMTLVRSHLPDFAAGLDHIPGRGRLVSDGRGGYWIEELHEVVAGNAFLLRPGGPAVDHRIRVRDTVIPLARQPGRDRLRIALEQDLP